MTMARGQGPHLASGSLTPEGSVGTFWSLFCSSLGPVEDRPEAMSVTESASSLPEHPGAASSPGGAAEAPSVGTLSWAIQNSGERAGLTFGLGVSFFIEQKQASCEERSTSSNVKTRQRRRTVP